MKKKIVFLADCLVTQKAGIHFYTKQFIRRVCQQYPDNQYYTITPYTYNELDTEEVIVPIKKYIPMHFRWRSFFDIPNAVKRINPDMVIEMAHFGPFRLPEKIKRVTVIYDLTPIIYPEWHDKMSNIIHRLFLPSILKKAHTIIAISEQTKKDILNYIPEVNDKIALAYPSHTRSKKPSQKTIKPEVHERLKSEKYLLSVGTIEPRKNYVRLIRAFDKICMRFPDIHLRLVGYKGWKSREFFQLVNNSSFSDRIILEGYTSEDRLQDLYKNATAFVFPSLYEGFGLPVLEALSHGIPVVCSDIPTSREICSDSAIYFDKYDVNELVEKLVYLLDDDNRREQYKALSKQRYIDFNRKKLNLDKLFE